MKQEMSHMCMGGMCPKCHGAKGLVIGLIILANVYWPFANWWTLIGALFVIGGLLKFVMPCCSHCK